jgi:hypothetical protein
LIDFCWLNSCYVGKLSLKVNNNNNNNKITNNKYTCKVWRHRFILLHVLHASFSLYRMPTFNWKWDYFVCCNVQVHPYSYDVCSKTFLQHAKEQFFCSFSFSFVAKYANTCTYDVWWTELNVSIWTEKINSNNAFSVIKNISVQRTDSKDYSKSEGSFIILWNVTSFNCISFPCESYKNISSLLPILIDRPIFL